MLSLQLFLITIDEVISGEVGGEPITPAERQMCLEQFPIDLEGIKLLRAFDGSSEGHSILVRPPSIPSVIDSSLDLDIAVWVR